MKKQIGMIFLMAFLGLLCIFWLLLYAPSLYVHHHEKSVAYPTNGVFYCKELDACLLFTSESIMLKTTDCVSQKIYVHPAGRFCTDNGINMWYSWIPEDKCIRIIIISFPKASQEDIFYFHECDMTVGYGAMARP